MVDRQAVQESFIVVEALSVRTQEVELGWVKRTRKRLVKINIYSR